MQQYLDLMREIVSDGVDRGDRTGTGTRSLFGKQLRFDLAAGFPLVTTKKVNFSNIVAELLWFLSGSTNVKDLQAMGCHIWDPWATEDGELGPLGYSVGWTNWNGVNQMAELVQQIRRNPNSRRHVISAWSVDFLPDESKSPQQNAQEGRMCLAPCHCLFQFYVAEGRLSCQFYQRSADYTLGVPYNIASYALLTHMIAQQCDLTVGELVVTFGDVHLYQNHLTYDVVYEQLSRTPKRLPELLIRRRPDSLFDYVLDDFSLYRYEPLPAIKAPISV